MTEDAQRRGHPDSERRAELLQRLVAYAAENGLADVSLRPLAVAVGSSPRVLLYFFGSKEELVREVHAQARQEQLRLFSELPTDADDPLHALWEWLVDPAHRHIERVFFDGYARSLLDADGPWQGFGAESVAAWLPPLERVLNGSGAADATLILAVLRGLLLDLLATGDETRVRRAFARMTMLLAGA